MKNALKLEDIKNEEHRKDIESILSQSKRRAIYERKIGPVKNQRAWDKLMALSDQISKEWKEVSAIEELKFQRR